MRELSAETDNERQLGGPVSSFVVESEAFLEEKIAIDVRNIKPLLGDHGRRRENCKRVVGYEAAIREFQSPPAFALFVPVRGDG